MFISKNMSKSYATLHDYDQFLNWGRVKTDKVMLQGGYSLV
jgi:hypothetical protein